MNNLTWEPTHIIFCGTIHTRLITIYNSYLGITHRIHKTYWYNEKESVADVRKVLYPHPPCPEVSAFDQTPSLFANILYGRPLTKPRDDRDVDQTERIEMERRMECREIERFKPIPLHYKESASSYFQKLSSNNGKHRFYHQTMSLRQYLFYS